MLNINFIKVNMSEIKFDFKLEFFLLYVLFFSNDFG